MYYSSESSDSESTNTTKSTSTSFDFSYLSLDSKTISVHLQNSIAEKQKTEKCSSKDEEEKLIEVHVEKLFLQHNLITILPTELIYFNKLKVLDLSNNNVQDLNDIFANLTSLQTIYLRNNELVDDSFPKDMSNLKKLKEINLSGNNLTRVPQQLFENLSLKYLYLGNNKITEIHPDIKHLIKYDYIF